MTATAHRIRLAYALVACALATTAGANPARKAAPDKYAAAAGAVFAQAMAAEDKGELEHADALYTRAFEISPHPSSAFNAAEVEVRLGEVVAAARSYELYLMLAGSAASDRREIEATVAELVRRPGRILVQDLPAEAFAGGAFAAYVLVDGEIVRRPGPRASTDQRGALMLGVPPGAHTVDVVTALTFASDHTTVPPGGLGAVRMTTPPRVDGSLVVTGARGIEVRLLNHPIPDKGARLVAAIGAHVLKVRDLIYECAPITVSVPSDGSVAYVHVASREAERYGNNDPPPRCRELAVKQHVLAFRP